MKDFNAGLDTSQINPLKLPSLPLGWRKGFPNCPAIYFAIADNKILYIGRTVKLSNRWKGHHRFAELESVGEVRIAWMEVSDSSLLPAIEKALIQYFKPSINQTHVKVSKPKTEVNRGQHPNSLANLQHGGRPSVFEEKKKVRAVSVTQQGWNGISQMAEQYGCSSISEFLEKLGRGEVKIA